MDSAENHSTDGGMSDDDHLHIKPPQRQSKKHKRSRSQKRKKDRDRSGEQVRETTSRSRARQRSDRERQRDSHQVQRQSQRDDRDRRRGALQHSYRERPQQDFPPRSQEYMSRQELHRSAERQAEFFRERLRELEREKERRQREVDRERQKLEERSRGYRNRSHRGAAPISDRSRSPVGRNRPPRQASRDDGDRASRRRLSGGGSSSRARDTAEKRAGSAHLSERESGEASDTDKEDQPDVENTNAEVGGSDRESRSGGEVDDEPSDQGELGVSAVESASERSDDDSQAPRYPPRGRFDSPSPESSPEHHYSADQRSISQSPSDYEKTPPAPPSPRRSPTPDPRDRLPPYLPAIMGCRTVDEFACLNRIEEGTYGVVYRAQEKKTGEIVALKRLKMEKEKEGFPITSLREINTLLKAQHKNIVTVREIVVGSNMDRIYIVMDFVEHDLKALMETMKSGFRIGEVKTMTRQLLSAVDHLHDNWILHRDLKCSNLLLSHQGILKIGDFGLAREYGSPIRPYTPVVVTLWYRAPELLLGTKEYSTAVDMWSVGCIFAELLMKKPLFPGKSEVDQLQKIFKDLGTPNESIWPGVSELPFMKKIKFPKFEFNDIKKRLEPDKCFGQTVTDAGIHFLNALLTYDPSKRMSARRALDHSFFSEAPKPIPPEDFPTWPAKSEGHVSRSKKEPTPKPPSGGKVFSKLMEDEQKFYLPFGNQVLVPQTGFNLHG